MQLMFPRSLTLSIFNVFVCLQVHVTPINENIIEPLSLVSRQTDCTVAAYQSGPFNPELILNQLVGWPIVRPAANIEGRELGGG